MSGVSCRKIYLFFFYHSKNYRYFRLLKRFHFVSGKIKQINEYEKVKILTQSKKTSKIQTINFERNILIILLSRAAEGHGPMKPGNLQGNFLEKVLIPAGFLT